MARVRRSGDLGSRDARARLPACPEPHFMVVERGLSLGYRKSREGGTWLVRRYEPGLRRHTETRIGTADDARDADGHEVLSFSQAQRKALVEAHQQAERVGGKHHTIADAVAEYVAYLNANGKSADDASIFALVLPFPGASRALTCIEGRRASFVSGCDRYFVVPNVLQDGVKVTALAHVWEISTHYQ